MPMNKAREFLNRIKETMRDTLNTSPDVITSNADVNGVVVLPYEGGYNRQQKQLAQEANYFNAAADRSRPGNVVGGVGPNETGGHYAEFWAGSSPNAKTPAGYASGNGGEYVQFDFNRSPNTVAANEEAGQMIDGVWITDNQLAAMIERRIALKKEADMKKREAIAAGYMPMRRINYDTNVPLKEIDIPFNLSSI